MKVYCKYSDKCRKQHIKENCENQKCEVEKCQKRHPKTCRYYQEYERCKFGEYCFYKHVQKESNQEIVKELEKVKDQIRMIENMLQKKDEEIKKILDNLKSSNNSDVIQETSQVTLNPEESPYHKTSNQNF